MRIAISGSSGLIGTALVEELRRDGHEVIRLVRRSATASSEIPWNPETGSLEAGLLTGCDAVINLAGAGVGDHRWTKSYKQKILDSRVKSTKLIAQACVEAKIPTLVNASAIGYYGDTGTQQVDESSPHGRGFLPEVVVAWEAAAEFARQNGVRVVHPRTGLVVSAKGGAWARMVPLFKFGLGGRLGNGKQYWSFISLRDELAAIKFVLTHEKISGPVNFVAPHAATNSEITKVMSQVFRRPAIAHAPAPALKLVLGEFSQEVLGSTRVVPQVLLDAGFTFEHPDAISAMKTLVAK
jgi:uncharacterized protein (TIGR01777 family)